MGSIQERIVATKLGSITSIQAIFVPADDLTVLYWSEGAFYLKVQYLGSQF